MIIDHSNMDSSDMATEPCPLDSNAIDILCVRCGWEGHAKVPHAPWPVFQEHIRKFSEHAFTMPLAPLWNDHDVVTIRN